MREAFRKLLDKGRSKLVESIDVEHGLLNLLIEKETITDFHAQSIKSMPTQYQKNEKLLDILKQRDDEHFGVFLETVKKYNPDLVTFIINLEKEIYQKSSAGTANRSTDHPISSNKCLSPLESEKLKQIGRNANNDVVLLEKKVLELEIEIQSLKTENTKYKSDLESQVNANNNLTEKLKQLEDKNVNLNSELSRVKQDLRDSRSHNVVLNESYRDKEKEKAKLSNDLKLKCDEIAILTERCRQQDFANEKLIKENKSLQLKLDELHNKNPSLSAEIKQTGTNLRIRGGSTVMGISLLNQRIYIVCLKSPKVFVFEDKSPYLQLTNEEFEITCMQNPRDLISSHRDRCLFIADASSDRNCKIWQLETVTGKFLTQMSMPTNAPSVMSPITSPLTSPLTNSAMLATSKMGSLDSGEILGCDGNGYGENRAKGSTFKITDWVINNKMPKKLRVSDNKALGSNKYNDGNAAKNVKGSSSSSNLSSSPNFIVVLTCECNRDNEDFSVLIYRISDRKMLRNFTLTPDIGEVLHVVVHTSQEAQRQCCSSSSSSDSGVSSSLPSLNGYSLTSSHKGSDSSDNFFNDILAKSTLIVTRKDVRKLQDGEESSLWLVSRLNMDGSKIKCFSSAIDGIELNMPEYITLDENDRIIVADQGNSRLVILGPRLDGGNTLVKSGAKHKLNKPARVVYNRDMRMLVVSEWGKNGLFDVFVF